MLNVRLSLDAGHVLQTDSKIFLMEELKILPRFFCETPRLVIIGNRCLKPLYTAVKRALIASTQPPDSPITTPRYRNGLKS